MWVRGRVLLVQVFKVRKMIVQEEILAEKIIIEIALMTIQGESDIRNTVLKKYGEFGFELAEQFIKEMKR